MAVDRAALAGLGASFATEIGRLETEIYAAVGHEFNLGSPKQLEQVLFYELDLPRGRRTKTGYSTDATVLEELRPAHPAIGMLLDWRVYTKLKSTYVDALPLMLDPRTGRLHTTFHQAVAATGRLSSSDPNLQNIPIRTDLGRSIRRTFVAGEPGTTLLAADYSQIELRVLAHVSGDAALRDAFARHADVHRDTAARVLHKDPADVTADERSMAKMVNFGIAYGMSDFGLSSRASIPRAEAQEFISRYFATYSGISYYMLHIKDQARQQGYVTTLLGRRRSIPELQQRNPNLRGGGRADGHQHAHPGHRRGHHEDRHDPAPRAAATRRIGRPPAAPGARRAACWRCRAAEVATLAPLVRETMATAHAARRAARRGRQGRRRLGAHDAGPGEGVGGHARAARGRDDRARAAPAGAGRGRGRGVDRLAARRSATRRRRPSGRASSAAASSTSGAAPSGSS